MAALVLLALSLPILTSLPMPAALAGIGLAVIAGSVLCTEIWNYACERWRTRDRYDLTLLSGTPEYKGPSRDDGSLTADLQPLWETEEGDVVYCHRCDVSMPVSYSVCPKCGSILG